MNCNAEWVRNALYLRQHACGLDSENQADRLTLLPIKSELLSVRYAMAHELSTICPCDRLGERNSIITDSIEADKSSTAGPIQMLAQASVGLFGLVVIVHTDKPIKDLPHRKRQIGSISPSTVWTLAKRSRVSCCGRHGARPRTRVVIVCKVSPLETWDIDPPPWLSGSATSAVCNKVRAAASACGHRFKTARGHHRLIPFPITLG